MNIEISLLAALIRHPEGLSQCDHLKEEHFSSDSAPIFRAIRQMQGDGLQPDWAGIISRTNGLKVTIVFMQDDRRVNAVNIRSYADDLVKDHNAAVAQSAIIEHLEKAKVIGSVHNPASELMRLGAELSKINEVEETKESTIDALLAEFESNEIPFSFEMINDHVKNYHLGGFGTGQLMLVGGRPSHGKSTLTRFIIFKNAMAGAACFVLTNEMTAKQVYRLLACLDSKTDGKALRSGEISDMQKAKFMQSLMNMKRIGIEVKEMGSKMFDDYELSIRRYVHSERLKDPNKQVLVFVDYLQQIRKEPKQSEEVQHNEFCYRLAALSKELSISVVMVCALRRINGETPKESHLRYAGGAEYAADSIILIEYPLKNFEDEEDINLEDPHKVLLYIRKVREGNVGIMEVRANMATGEFRGVGHEFESDSAPRVILPEIIPVDSTHGIII